MLSVATSATVKLLQVAQLPGIGPARIRKILLAQKTPGLLPDVLEVPTAAARDKASLIIEQCHRYEVRIVSLCDEDYPDRLRKITDAPPFLYIRGDLAAILKPCAAVVGTRKASKSGLRAASLIAQFLAERGITIVSGLALGIDAAGHEGALAANGLTAAILAHGLHIVAPTSHKDLADRILSSHGALVSEHPPESRQIGPNSCDVIVFKAASRSVPLSSRAVLKVAQSIKPTSHGSKVGGCLRSSRVLGPAPSANPMT